MMIYDRVWIKVYYAFPQAFGLLSYLEGLASRHLDFHDYNPYVAMRNDFSL